MFPISDGVVRQKQAKQWDGKCESVATDSERSEAA